MADAIHERCCQDIASLIGELGLAGQFGVMPDLARIYVQLLEEQLQLLFPCVLVTTQGQSEEELESSFEEDYVNYPVRVMILDPMAPNYQARRPIYLRWRLAIAQMLRGRVHHPLLPSTPECWDIRLANLPTVDEKAPEHPFYRAGLVAWCHTSTARIRNA